MAISTTFTLKFSGAAVERGLNRVKAGFKSLGNAALKLGKLLISPFAGIAAAVGGLIAARSLVRTAIELNAIGEAGRAGDRALANITKQMGLFGDESDNVTKRLIDFADKTARMTGVDGEAIATAQTKLMTFRELAKSADVAGGAFDRATMAAIDMASAGFGEASTNAVQLGKALNDPVKGINSLTRSGITFTEKEKSKIAALVASNKMLDAQEMILKAIETQVGGTAAASATSSGKIRESWTQIKEAFAEPFSMGIDAIPGAFEKTFPKIIAKAEELGLFIGAAISESVAGDNSKFELLGRLIGENIWAGIKNFLEGSAIDGISAIVNDGMTRLGKGQLTKFGKDKVNRMRDKIIGNLAGGKEVGQAKNRVGADIALQQYKIQANILRPNTYQPEKNDPYTGYTNESEAHAKMLREDSQKTIRILESINGRLAPQP